MSREEPTPWSMRWSKRLAPRGLCWYRLFATACGATRPILRTPIVDRVRGGYARVSSRGSKAQSPKPFDLVLMDVHMPRLNGLDALAQIRQRDPRVKAVMLSGGLQEKDAEHSAEIEGVRFLQKPFENQELVCLVREMIDAPGTAGYR